MGDVHPLADTALHLHLDVQEVHLAAPPVGEARQQPPPQRYVDRAAPVAAQPPHVAILGVAEERDAEAEETLKENQRGQGAALQLVQLELDGEEAEARRLEARERARGDGRGEALEQEDVGVERERPLHPVGGLHPAARRAEGLPEGPLPGLEAVEVGRGVDAGQVEPDVGTMHVAGGAAQRELRGAELAHARPHGELEATAQEPPDEAVDVGAVAQEHDEVHVRVRLHVVPRPVLPPLLAAAHGVAAGPAEREGAVQLHADHLRGHAHTALAAEQAPGTVRHA
mmetsp:Transcript_81709/g.231606  ORF Transcript_81709/g.231606 Transcript_81709/m.231606 type:complete len:284 (+) Transcript_81709:255-1106(+)